MKQTRRHRGRTGHSGIKTVKTLVPESTEVEILLGFYQAQKFKDAEILAQRLVRANPAFALGWQVLGAIFLQTTRLNESLSAMEEAVRLLPRDAAAHSNLATILLELGRLEESVTAFKTAVSINPLMAEGHNNYGNALMALARHKDAKAAFLQAIEINPGYFEAHNNLGNCLRSLGSLKAAEEAYRLAILLEPNYVDAHNNLGNVLQDMGRYEEAITEYRRAIAMRPSYGLAYSNLLYSLNFSDTIPDKVAAFEAKAFGEMLSAAATPKFKHKEESVSFEKLKIGFVSGDFKRHPVGYFLEGLLKHLDKSRFEVVAIPTQAYADDVTLAIKGYASEWLPIYGVDDSKAAKIIHERGIHILIDLSGHTAHNRLGVFAYKPAPVQVSWLGYFATTGLPEIDFFLGDPMMSPEHEAVHFSENVWRLPQTWLCLEPPSEEVSILPIPALHNGYVTFGCFGNLAKIGDAVVETWATILERVPNSKLFLKAKQLTDSAIVESIQGRFLQHGIAADRLILEAPSTRAEYFAAYNRVDVVLDTFPYPGGTTSVDALWMGRAVLTLKGDRFLSHLGESIVTNAGLADWIAHNRVNYVEKATYLASKPEHIASLCENLREKVLKTPIFDTSGFALNFGQTVTEMWKQRPLS